MANISDFVTNFFDWSLQTDSFESDLSILNTNQFQVIANNPRRISLYITNTGQTMLAISRLNTLTMLTGRLIVPGETVELYWYNELREIEKPWFGIFNAATNSSLHLREVVFV